ncbi:MAG: adenosine deaminase [Alphaproteobacteria bacterium]
MLKADIHCHMEGTIGPELARRLAQRNDISLPEALFREDGSYAWTDFNTFLKAYDMVAASVQTPEDYRDVTYEHFAGGAAQGMIYGEVFTSPDHAASSGLSYEAMMEGIEQGLADAKNDHGVEGRIIATAVRHLGVEAAEAVAALVVRQAHPLVTGFGMGGDELMGHPGDFARAFAIAHEAGLECTVHAGEVDGPESVRAALDTLPVKRIGHGVRAVEDPELVARLADSKIVLEVCPGSNVALQIFPSRAAHPLRQLRDAGCIVTINADDPPFFWTDIGAEYEGVSTQMGFTDAEMHQLTRNAVNAAFVDEDTRAHLLARLDAQE